MNRLLLTLLALLTGIVAQVSPASAAVRTGGEMVIGLSETRPTGQPVASALSDAGQGPSSKPRRPTAHVLHVAPSQWRGSSVLIGIDRARE